MKTIAQVKEIDGIFYAKDLQGNIRRLKTDDNILLNDLVYGSKYNKISAKLTTAFSGGGQL